MHKRMKQQIDVSLPLYPFLCPFLPPCLPLSPNFLKEIICWERKVFEERDILKSLRYGKTRKLYKGNMKHIAENCVERLL